REIVEPPRQARKVADAVAVRVGVGLDVEAVDDDVLVPLVAQPHRAFSLLAHHKYLHFAYRIGGGAAGAGAYLMWGVRSGAGWKMPPQGASFQRRLTEGGSLAEERIDASHGSCLAGGAVRPGADTGVPAGGPTGQRSRRPTARATRQRSWRAARRRA